MTTAKASPSTSLSSADLAFIDAAIAMQKAVQASSKAPAAGAPTVAFDALSFTGIINLVVAAVQVATFVYHAVKGRIPTIATQLVATKVDAASSASISELIAHRNELAKALGDKSVLS